MVTVLMTAPGITSPQLTTEGVVLGVWSLKRVYNFITQMNPTQTSNHTPQTDNTSSLAVVN